MIQITTRPRITRSDARSPWTNAPQRSRRVRPRGRSVPVAARAHAAAPRRSPFASPPSAGTGDRRDDVLLRWSASRVEAARRPPRRSTKMRSATSNTSARLWLITTTPRPRSRRRLISSSTCAVCGDAERGRRLVEQHHLRLAEQRARDRDLLALAAGEAAHLGAHARDRDRELLEQLVRPVLHRRLVELARDRCPGPGEITSCPRKRFATTSRLSHSARSW